MVHCAPKRASCFAFVETCVDTKFDAFAIIIVLAYEVLDIVQGQELSDQPRLGEIAIRPWITPSEELSELVLSKKIYLSVTK